MRIHSWETIITEGKAKIIIPKPDLFKRPDGVYEPAWAPIFYNPRAIFNRDVAVVFTRTVFSREFFFVEPLAGSGVRSIRYVLESNGNGIANDIDPASFYYIRRNIELNNIDEKLLAYNNEANVLLNTLRAEGIVIDYIDIDPYGTPIPFVDSSIYAISRGGYLAFTATDTGPLNCSHPNVCLRRYGAYCMKTDFSKEMGLRILIGSIIRRAASHDVGLEVVLSYYHDYYYRVYFKAYKSAKKADEVLSQIGYIAYNSDTLKRKLIKQDELREHAKQGYILIGPLWIGELASKEFLEKAIATTEKLISTQEYNYLKKTLDFLKNLYNEYTVNKVYYRYDKLFGLLKKNQPPISLFIEKIREKGYNAFRTHFDPRGVKTDMPHEDLVRLIEHEF